MIETLSNCNRFSPSPDFAVFVIKPDGLLRNVGGISVPVLVKGLFTSINLEIILQSERLLTEESVRRLYRILNQPSEYGEDWKREVAEHMCSRPVVSFLLYGKDAESKVKLIKDYLRLKLTDRNIEREKIVENVAHVADLEDFRESVKILFD